MLQLLILSAQTFDFLFEPVDTPIPLIYPAISPRDLLFQVRDALLLFFRPAHPASVYSYETVNSYGCYRINCAIPQVVSASHDRAAKTITIQFSKLMDAASLDAAIAITTTLDRIVTLTSDVATMMLVSVPDETITPTVKKSAKETTGASMAADYTQSFSLQTGPTFGHGDGYINGVGAAEPLPAKGPTGLQVVPTTRRLVPSASMEDILMANHQRYNDEAASTVSQRFNAGEITIPAGQSWKTVLGREIDSIAGTLGSKIIQYPQIIDFIEFSAVIV